MMKYVIAVLVFIAALAGTLLYVGDDARLVITSTAQDRTAQIPAHRFVVAVRDCLADVDGYWCHRTLDISRLALASSVPPLNLAQFCAAEIKPWTPSKRR